MKLLLSAQLVWSLLGLLMAGYLVSNDAYASAFWAIFGTCGNSYLAISLFRGARWAWWVTLAACVSALLTFGPVVGFEVINFFSSHTVVKHSQANYVAWLVAAAVLLPAIAMLCLLPSARRQSTPNPALQQDAPTSGAPLS